MKKIILAAIISSILAACGDPAMQHQATMQDYGAPANFSHFTPEEVYQVYSSSKNQIDENWEEQLCKDGSMPDCGQ